MPSPEERLIARIREHGPIPFAEFMEEALYGEGGYYASDEIPIAGSSGVDGDFVTGSSVSKLFGRCTARLLRRIRSRLSRADFLEVGYGTGAHLASVGEALGTEWDGSLQAWDRVQRPLPPGVGRLSEFKAEVEGVVFSYELLDALPFHRLVRRDQEWLELGVTHGADGFGWVEQPFGGSTSEIEFAGESWAPEEGQIVDWTAERIRLYSRLASCLKKGLLVTCDYGFSRRRLLDVRVRRHGTLACYRRQTVHRDPFVDIGSQDITSHVDFTSLIEAGEAEGLVTLGLISQAEFLGACGLFDDLQDADQATRVEAAHLMNLEGMGTDLRVLIQARDFDPGDVLTLKFDGLPRGC